MTYILYNTHAGHQNTEQKLELESLTSSFQGNAEKKDVASTEYKTFIPTLKQEDTVILCGGDGTLNHFINETDFVPWKFFLFVWLGGMILFLFTATMLNTVLTIR